VSSLKGTGHYALTQDQVINDMNLGTTAVTFTIGPTAASREYCVPGDTSCSSPVAEWKFDAGTGSTAVDSSGNTKHGTLGAGGSAPSWITGKSGKALNFDGVDDYVSTTLAPSTSFTWSAWFKTGSISNGVYQSILAVSGASYMLMDIINGSGTFWSPDGLGGGNYGVINLTTDRWYYLTLVREGNSTTNGYKIYLDGVLTGQANSGTWSSADPIHIGRRNDLPTQIFTGAIDQIRIYNYARTPAQIAYDFNKGAPRAHWRLDECQGSTAYDSSGSSQTGTITIGAVGITGPGTCTTSGAWKNGASGKINASLSLDGSDDLVSVGSTIANINSLALWFKATNATTNIIQLGSSIYIGSTAVGSSGAIVATGFSSPSIYINGVGTTIFSPNVWQHLTLTTDTTITADTIKLGQTPSGYFSGQIDDVRLFSYPLSATQIKTTINNGSLFFSGSTPTPTPTTEPP